MARSQRIRPIRIAFAVLVFAILLVTGFHLLTRSTPVEGDSSHASWIGLPRSGMDASEHAMRQLLKLAERYGVSNVPLSLHCGGAGLAPAPPDERYVAMIGEDAFSMPWVITLDVLGEEIIATWQELMPPPPSEAMPSATRSPFSPHASLRADRRTFDAVRSFWDSDALWHSEQKVDALECRDGMPVLLEACIHGRYAARFSNCDEAGYKAGQQLWQAFQDVLPPPPEAHWRDASGKPLPPDGR